MFPLSQSLSTRALIERFRHFALVGHGIERSENASDAT
jgi:hypothetical protein